MGIEDIAGNGSGQFVLTAMGNTDRLNLNSNPFVNLVEDFFFLSKNLNSDPFVNLVEDVNTYS